MGIASAASSSSRSGPVHPRWLLPAAILCFSSFSAARSQCIDYEQFPHWEGNASVTDPRGVVVSGDYAYVGGLEVLDVRDPSRPTKVAEVEAPGPEPGPPEFPSWLERGGPLALFEEHVYVASAVIRSTPCFPFPCEDPLDWFAGTALGVVDVREPFAPQPLGYVSLGRVNDLDVTGGRLFCAGDQLWEIDVSDPHLPQVVTSVPSGQQLSAVEVHERWIIVAGDDLLVFDVGEPGSPRLEATLPGAGGHDLAIVGDYAYVVADELRVVDLRNPRSPLVVATLDISGGEATDIRATGDHLALLVRPSGEWYATGATLWTFDVSTPLLPRVIAGSDAPVVFYEFTGIPNVYDRPYLALGPEHAYVLDPSFDLSVFDLGHWASHPIEGSSPAGHRSPRGLAITGHHAYAVGANPALQIFDVSDPAAPLERGSLYPSGAVEAVAVEGKHAYLAGRNGLRIVDVEDPEAPVPLGVAGTPDVARSVAVAGDLAYVGFGSSYGYRGGLRILDVSDRSLPLQVADVGMDTAVWDVELAGDLAYVGVGSAYGFQGLRILDVSDRASPFSVGEVAMPSDARAVTVVDGFAYVGTGSAYGYANARGELHVVNVNDPSLPEIEGSVETWDWVTGVTVAGGFAYVSCSWVDGQHFDVSATDLRVIDVTDPSAPRIVGGADWPGDAAGPVVVDDHVYLATSEGLKILPVHCRGPTPVLLSGFGAEIVDRAVLLSWHTSFEDLHDGFHVYRSPRLGSGYSRLTTRLVRGASPYSYLDTTVRPSTTYYYKLGSVDLEGYEVLHDPIEVSTPAWGARRTALHFASPNPFRHETRIEFSLASDQDVKLTVYDVTGRRVRALVSEKLPGGDHAVVWDGADDRGARVAGGTHFVRFETPELTRVRKVVHLGGR